MNTFSRLLFSNVLLIVMIVSNAQAQKDFYNAYTFTKADSLRGMLRPERTCFDVNHYAIDLTVDIPNQSIAGSVETRFLVKEPSSKIQLDLWKNMNIESVIWRQEELSFERIADAFFITFPEELKVGAMEKVTVNYNGQPHVAKMAPWDGGFVWSKDEKGNPWIGVACEGDGASLWWPNKDHLSDEPDGVTFSITVPEELTAVCNGQLTSEALLEGGLKKFTWEVTYPINNYNVTLNIAKYAHFYDEYESVDGRILDLDYYVLEYNLDKAKKQFKQVEPTLSCFGEVFGEYPFWEDGFKLVETPYLGMEHQSAIAYGNFYLPGYLGRHPKGFDFDYIIIHETGHEWFGNSISCNDLSEMWIHESFTTYMEAIYVECTQGYEKSVEYLNAFRGYIANKEPILGPDNVNWEDWEHGDHYYKGMWMLHTLRHTLGDESTWYDLLKGFYQKHKISNVVSEDFYTFVNEFTKKDYDPFFEQYLQYTKVP
ncbi:MAG: M1 family metallopeptidase, partial [Bacteroidota bacterium]